MPTTPKVKINFKNENVQASTPQLGISHFLARTTKGKFNNPEDIISSYSQFSRLYGEEIVPDGSISNIKKALSMRSKIRVSRVAGSEASYGYAELGESPKTFSMVFTSSKDSSTVTMSFKIRSKEQGSKFEDSFDNIYLKFSLDSTGPKSKIILSLYSKEEATDEFLIDSQVFIAWNDTTKVVDYKSLQTFIDQISNVDVEVTGTFNGLNIDIYSIVAWLSNHIEYIPSSDFVTDDVYSLSMGNDGGKSTTESWEEAYKAISEYNDAYELYLSHIHQHLPDSYTTVYKNIADYVVRSQEIKIMVELPKPSSNTTIENYLKSLQTLVKSVGQNQFICYYGGGIKYYDDLGVIRDCDVLGSVAGLMNVSASKYGPWYSSAGPNRGIIADALGPVMKNLGSPSEIDTLQQFADWYMNLFVIKNTQYAGKRTMLWHNFTSNPVSDSSIFISTVNLILYIKKNLRPILESYIEEPNTFSTWKDIYYKVKPILDDLVTNNAMTSYEWYGDQNAQSYEDLQVNTEADVRSGKYKVELTFKDIVTMQEITLGITISSSSKSVDISINE